MRIRSLLAVVAALLVLIPGAAQAVVELEPVLTGRADEYAPRVNDTYIAYTRFTRANGSIAYARPVAGGADTRLNRTGTEAEAGGFDPGTNRVIFHQWNRRGSDLFFYDLDTGERSEVPAVNSRRAEYFALISSTFVAFVRDRVRQGEVISSLNLQDRASGTLSKVRTWGERVFVVPGAVGDRYLAYTLCKSDTCFVYLYDSETGTEARVPTVNGRPQYTPLIDETDGTVYFTRSGFRCGRGVNILRLPLSLTGEPTQIVNLPDGFDLGWSGSLTPNAATGGMDLYIPRVDCSTRTGDIYVARGVDAEGTLP